MGHLSNEANPCFHTFKNEKLKHECLKLLDGNETAPTLINQLRKELGLLPIPQHVGNNALISVQKSVTCNPSLNVASEIVHISNMYPLANVSQLPSYVYTLYPPDIVAQTPSNPPTIVTHAPSNPPTIVTQAPSNPPTIVTHAPSFVQTLNPPDIIAQTPLHTPNSVTQTPTHIPTINTHAPSTSNCHSNTTKPSRSPKHDTPQKPKKKLKFSRKELLANDFKILNRSLQVKSYKSKLEEQVVESIISTFLNNLVTYKNNAIKLRELKSKLFKEIPVFLDFINLGGIPLMEMIMDKQDEQKKLLEAQEYSSGDPGDLILNYD
ncbi:hypothetical protein ACTFIR_009793 [Dictyostelium discoideum]